MVKLFLKDIISITSLRLLPMSKAYGTIVHKYENMREEVKKAMG
jgi:hypothetical protein